jgi:hypothetical protein
MISKYSVLMSMTAVSVQVAPPPLVGRWDLIIQGPERSFPGWLEVRTEGSGLVGRLQWGSGHATALAEIVVSDGRFTFVWPNEGDPKAAASRAEGRVTGGRERTLSATLTGRDGLRYQIGGVPAPALGSTPADTAAWGAPVDLLAGGLTGWKARDARNGWKLTDGILANTMPSSDLISRMKFKDFQLHLEVEVPPGGNSGIYLRGRHEVQVLDSWGKPTGSREMGGVYGQVTPTVNAAAAPGEWQSFDITFVGRLVKVVLNGTTIIDFAEIPGITGGALDSNEGTPGPLMLQGDHTGVRYRNILITPAVQDTPTAGAVRQVELNRFVAMMGRDTTALRSALADELSYTHSNGLVESKAMHLEAVGSGRTVYQTIGPRGMSYRQVGETVVGNGMVKSQGSLAGTAFDVMLRVTTVHIRRAGRWQLVAWQSTRVP